MNLPIIDRRNYRKVLRELDLSLFPTLPDFLLDYRKKLIKKEPIEYIDDARAYGKFKKYLDDTEKEINKYVLDKIDWDVISERPPRDFQKDGIKFLILNNRCILADDMGLGKSLQSVLASKFLPDEYNILVITLKTLKYNFANEISFYDDRVSVIDKEWTPNKFTIVHYDALKKWKKELVESRFEVIIIDECFPYDTLVKTDKGELKIGDIVTKKIKAQILSYNINTLKLEYKPIVNYWDNGRKDTILEISLLNESNQYLNYDMTHNHKIFIANDNQYKSANQIKRGEKVYILRKRKLFQIFDSLFAKLLKKIK
jgi:hypothetical protein